MQAAERRRSDQALAQAMAPQQMGRSPSGHVTSTEDAPEVLQQVGRAYSLQPVSSACQQGSSASLQPMSRAQSGHIPDASSMQNSTAAAQRMNPAAQPRHASPGLMQRQMSHEHLPPMTRSLSGRSAHSGPSPTPPPLAPRSDSARRAYRFIDNNAPPSGDDLAFRARRPAMAPPQPHMSPSADQTGGLPGSSHMPGRGLVRDSPAAPLSSAPAAELPYADLIPIMGAAGGTTQAARARAYAFIDDSSGDEFARRLAPPRQLPTARPTGGWVEEPVPEAARVWQDEAGHWHSSSGGSQSALSRDHVSDDPLPHAAGASSTGHPPQRITPGLDMHVASGQLLPAVSTGDGFAMPRESLKGTQSGCSDFL